MPNAPTIKLSNPVSEASPAEHVQSTLVPNLEAALAHVQARRTAPENLPVFAGENNAVFVIRPHDPEAPLDDPNNGHTVHEYVDPAWLETSNAGNYELTNSTLQKGDIMIGTDGEAYRVDENQTARAMGIARNLITSGDPSAARGDQYETYRPLDATTKVAHTNSATSPASGTWDADLHSPKLGVKLRK